MASSLLSNGLAKRIAFLEQDVLLQATLNDDELAQFNTLYNASSEEVKRVVSDRLREVYHKSPCERDMRKMRMFVLLLKDKLKSNDNAELYHGAVVKDLQNQLEASKTLISHFQAENDDLKKEVEKVHTLKTRLKGMEADMFDMARAKQEFEVRANRQAADLAGEFTKKRLRALDDASKELNKQRRIVIDIVDSLLVPEEKGGITKKAHPPMELVDALDAMHSCVAKYLT